MSYNVCKCRENRARDSLCPGGAFIFRRLVKSQYKFQFLGSYTFIVAANSDWSEIWRGGVNIRSTTPRQISPPHHFNGSPLRGEKSSKYGRLGNFYTGALRCAQCCRLERSRCLFRACRYLRRGGSSSSSSRDEYYLGGTIALLLQDHRTMSTTGSL